MREKIDEPHFKDIYGLHSGGVLEFTFVPFVPNDRRVHRVLCSHENKEYQFLMHVDGDKNNHVISQKEKIPNFIADLESNMSESIFNHYSSYRHPANKISTED